MTRQASSAADQGYLDHLGLTHSPFPVAPDDANFYLSRTIEEILAEIVHGICTRKGFIILSGDVGLGKTTISRRIISILESKGVTTSLVLHTSLQDVELLRAINHDFGLQCDGETDPGMSAQIRRLNDFLLAQHARGKNCAIIIDDAQNLNRPSLELIRMISNLEADQQKLVQILLVGQTELLAKLKSPDLRQLTSRSVINKMVRSLTREELRSYIAFKLGAAGDAGRISLTPAAFRKLYGLTRGNLRRVNLIMDRCLYAICMHGDGHRISRKIVHIAESDLSPGPGRSAKRMLALAVCGLLPLALVLGSWAVHLYTSRNSLADILVRSSVFKVPSDTAAEAARAPACEPRPEVRALDQGTRPVDPVDPAVTAFLNIYQLNAYTSRFQRALREGGLDHLALSIYAERGYQLVRLPTISENIRRRYGALAFTLKPGQSPEWLLFWRPQLMLKRFYYNYQGEEVYQLQQLFSKVNLYRYRLDGIVGAHLMHAVIAFQKRSGLPVTGFPDADTIFLLCHQQEKNADV
jgi:general secretion pathway protein A